MARIESSILAGLAVLIVSLGAAILLGITLYLYTGGRKDRLEEPARRMLEEDDA